MAAGGANDGLLVRDPAYYTIEIGGVNCIKSNSSWPNRSAPEAVKFGMAH